MELEAAGQKYTGTFEGDVNGDCFSGTFTGMDGWCIKVILSITAPPEKGR